MCIFFSTFDTFLAITKEGDKKFIKAVEHITFSGPISVKLHPTKTVLCIYFNTHRSSSTQI